MDPASFAVVAARAAEQAGLISLGQLAGLGVTESQRRALAGRGAIRRVAPRVYAMAGVPRTLEYEQHRALLCLGAGAALSHECAARLHRFDRCLPDRVELVVMRHRHGVEVPCRVHTTRVLPALDIVRVDGFPCTSATRTIIDLARARVPRIRLEAAVDTAVRTGASSPLVIALRLAELRGPGRWGVRRLDELLADAGGHTMLERRFLTLLRLAGLPRPATQVVHRDGGRTFARVDFLYPELGVVVEVSGRTGHSSPAERARDAERRNELQHAGRRVLEYTWQQVTRQPSTVAADVRAHLVESGWRAPA